jgi:hypothetical protein
MLISQAFPSNYLKASDLQGRTVTATIESCELEELGDATKPVLRFRGQSKGAVLNKTNALNLAAAYGEDTAGWIGKSVQLSSQKVQYQGRLVDGLRVSVPAQAAAEAFQAPVAEEAPPFDDEINF